MENLISTCKLVQDEMGSRNLKTLPCHLQLANLHLEILHHGEQSKVFLARKYAVLMMAALLMVAATYFRDQTMICYADYRKLVVAPGKTTPGRPLLRYLLIGQS